MPKKEEKPEIQYPKRSRLGRLVTAVKNKKYQAVGQVVNQPMIVAAKYAIEHKDLVDDIAELYYWSKNTKQFQAYGNDKTDWEIVPVWWLEFIPEVVMLSKLDPEETMLESIGKKLYNFSDMALKFGYETANQIKKIYQDKNTSMETFNRLKKFVEEHPDLLYPKILDVMFVNGYWKAHSSEFEAYGKQYEQAWVRLPTDYLEAIQEFLDPEHALQRAQKRQQTVTKQHDLNYIIQQINFLESKKGMSAIELALQKAKIQEQALLNDFHRIEKKIFQGVYKDASHQARKAAQLDGLGRKMANIRDEMAHLSETLTQQQKQLAALKVKLKGQSAYQASQSLIQRAEASLDKLKVLNQSMIDKSIKKIEQDADNILVKLENMADDKTRRQLSDQLAEHYQKIDNLRDTKISRMLVLDEVLHLKQVSSKNLTEEQKNFLDRYESEKIEQAYSEYIANILVSAKSGYEYAIIEQAMFEIGEQPVVVPKHLFEINYENAISNLNKVIENSLDKIAIDRAKVALAIAKINQDPSRQEISHHLRVLVRLSVIGKDLASKKWAKDFIDKSLVNKNLPIEIKHEIRRYLKAEKKLFDNANDLKIRIKNRQTLENDKLEKQKQQQQSKAMVAKAKEKLDVVSHPLQHIEAWQKRITPTSGAVFEKPELTYFTQDQYSKMDLLKLKAIQAQFVEAYVADKEASEKAMLEEQLSLISKAIKPLEFDVENYKQKQRNTSYDNKREELVLKSISLSDLSAEKDNFLNQYIKAAHDFRYAKSRYNQLLDDKKQHKALRFYQKKSSIPNPSESELKAALDAMNEAYNYQQQVLEDWKVVSAVLQERLGNPKEDIGNMSAEYVLKGLESDREQLAQAEADLFRLQNELEMLNKQHNAWHAQLWGPTEEVLEDKQQEVKQALKKLGIITESTQDKGKIAKTVVFLDKVEPLEINRYSEVIDLVKMPVVMLKDYNKALESVNLKQSELDNLLQQKQSWWAYVSAPSEVDIARVQGELRAAEKLRDTAWEAVSIVTDVYNDVVRSLDTMALDNLKKLIDNIKAAAKNLALDMEDGTEEQLVEDREVLDKIKVFLDYAEEVSASRTQQLKADTPNIDTQKGAKARTLMTLSYDRKEKSIADSSNVDESSKEKSSPSKPKY